MNCLEDLLSFPSFIINLDRNPERLINTFNLLKNAKFKHLFRFKAIDGKINDLKTIFSHVLPDVEFDDWDQDFQSIKGKQGCFLSHFLIWDHIISNKIPYTNIFEDDIMFHESWSLADFYIKNTPKDFDLIFIGSKVMFKPENFITVNPCYCTHAYVLSYNGALKLKNYFMKTPIFTVDCKLYLLMQKINECHDNHYIKWYVWNTNDFNEELLLTSTSNNGLILQDDKIKSEILTVDSEKN